VTVQEQYSLNDVKYISPGIVHGTDPGSWLQNTYVVSPSGRLLLRFDGLEGNVSSINVSGTNTVELQLAGATAADATTAQTAAQICPVTRNWSPLATWTSAHPFGGGQWSEPGGDYDVAGCVPVASVNANVLLFNVTQWFIDYPRGRGEDLGLLLISSQAFAVIGESSGEYSPRLIWQQ
jgi:hypothetical protein